MLHVEKYSHKSICVVASSKFDITTQKTRTVSQYITLKNINQVIRRSEEKWQNIKNYEGRNWKQSRNFTVIMLFYKCMISPHQRILHEVLVGLAQKFTKKLEKIQIMETTYWQMFGRVDVFCLKITTQKWWGRYQLNQAWQGKMTKEWLFTVPCHTKLEEHLLISLCRV